MTTAQVVKTSVAVDKSIFRPTLTHNWHRIVCLDFCLVDSRSHKGRRSSLCKREDICCRRGLASRITIGLFAAVRAVHAVITVYCGANSATVSQAKQEVTHSYITLFFNSPCGKGQGLIKNFAFHLILRNRFSFYCFSWQA